MACMTHDCGNCGHMEFNNRSMLVCPKCGSYEVLSHYDDYYDDDRDDEQEEE
jgi:predicted  nucleic acid-binding Zn-ribbon protein